MSVVGATVTLRVSSSLMVSDCADGAVTPTLLLAVAEIVTVLSAASTSSSTAVTVTTPVLVLAPAAMVSTRLVLSV